MGFLVLPLRVNPASCSPNFCIMGLKPVKLSSPTSSFPASHSFCLRDSVESPAQSGLRVWCILNFFAGVIFTSSLQRSAGSDYAFSANILGTIAGGFPPYISFLFGMKAPLPIGAVLYRGLVLVNFIGLAAVACLIIWRSCTGLLVGVLTCPQIR